MMTADPAPQAVGRTGADDLVSGLAATGIEVCFANPGTSEMAFVAALDRSRSIRPVLGLFEGVVTGAADGYARMRDKPAAALLHCAAGLANGLANLHNARRARTPVVNLVGDMATFFRAYDSPLTADTEGLARAVSTWVRTADSSQRLGDLGVAAVEAALLPPCNVATLVMPSDTLTGPGSGRAFEIPPAPKAAAVDELAIRVVAQALRSGEPAALLIGGQALRAEPLAIAWAIARATGARFLAPQANGRIERGAGRAPIERVPTPVAAAVATFAAFKHIILVGAPPPVPFFFYDGYPCSLVPPDATLHTLSRADQDGPDALRRLADCMNIPLRPDPFERAAREVARGRITPEALARSIGALLPDDAIIVDESVSLGRSMFKETERSARHDWLQVTGGAIGDGPPLAVGAAIAAPARRVINIEGDGSAMYTVQALWTQAREKLGVTTIILANRSYGVLYPELARMNAPVGPAADAMLEICGPELDWLQLAKGMGVPAARAETLEQFNDLFAVANRHAGPFLIEAVFPDSR